MSRERTNIIKILWYLHFNIIKIRYEIPPDAGADLDHVTYGLWRTKILPNCNKSFKIVGVMVLILILIQIWRNRKSFLYPPLQARIWTCGSCNLITEMECKAINKMPYKGNECLTIQRYLYLDPLIQLNHWDGV